MRDYTPLFKAVAGVRDSLRQLLGVCEIDFPELAPIVSPIFRKLAMFSTAMCGVEAVETRRQKLET